MRTGNSIERDRLKELLKDALWVEGDHHKQWYLWQIAGALCFPKDAFDERETPDEGIAP